MGGGGGVGGVHPDPEISGGWGAFSGPHFGQKIRGAGPSGPSPGSATVYVLKCSESPVLQMNS